MEVIIFLVIEPYLIYITDKEGRVMTYDVRNVANWFIQKAIDTKQDLTHLKLQKLLYFSEGWYLSLTNGRSIISQPVEAWMYGPVFNDLYQDLKHYKSTPIQQTILQYDNKVCIEDEELLERIWELYSGFQPSELVSMTHKQGSPWYDCYENNSFFNNMIIPKDKIRKYFDSLQIA